MPRNQLCRNGKVVSNLFLYSRDDLAAFLKKQGAAYAVNNLFRVDRNSSGTLLYFYFEGREALVVGAKEVQRLKQPGRAAFLNDAGKFVAWTDDFNKGINFADGSNLKLAPFAAFGVDSGGGYYFTQSGSGPTEIYGISKPRTVLASVNFEARKIFVKNQRVYLFGSNRRNIRGPGDYEVFEVIGNIFNISPQGLKFEIELRIPRPSRPGASPFTVLDLDPYSDQMLLLDAFDDPFRSQFYLGQLNSNKLAHLGADKHSYAHFLKYDLIKGALLK